MFYLRQRLIDGATQNIQLGESYSFIEKSVEASGYIFREYFREHYTMEYIDVGEAYDAKDSLAYYFSRMVEGFVVANDVTFSVYGTYGSYIMVGNGSTFQRLNSEDMPIGLVWDAEASDFKLPK